MSAIPKLEDRRLKKSSSCSTIYVEDDVCWKPNLRNTVKCITSAIYDHIQNRSSSRTLDIFDEKIHPLTKDKLPDDYDQTNPSKRSIYMFMRTLFNAARLNGQEVIITIIYIEKLLMMGKIDLLPSTWKRIVLGGVILSSKAYNGEEEWNSEFCQIFNDVTIQDMDELESQFLIILQFQVNIPIVVYAEYYFRLRSLTYQNCLTFPTEPLSKERAWELEAMEDILIDFHPNMQKRASLDNLTFVCKSPAILF